MSIESIKREIDLAGYVRSCGIELTKHGSKDLKGLCPFHDDHNPSLIISPDKQLFNCPACGTGGSVIDFAAKYHKITVAEAIKRLSSPLRDEGTKEGAAKKEKNYPENPVDPVGNNLPPERQAELLERTISFYEKTFANVAEGKSYLESRGMTDAGLFVRHRIGYADGSLLNALPKEGKIIDDLKALGILVELANGDLLERFRGCVVFPVFDARGNVVTLYGRSVSGPSTSLRTSKKHVYLPDRPTGLFNIGAAKTYPEIVLVESCIDALSCEMAGISNVVSIQSTNGFTGEKSAEFAECGVRKIILFLDGDDPGRVASEKLSKLLAESFEVQQLPLPDGMDPNDYLRKNGPERLQEFFTESKSEILSSKSETNPNPENLGKSPLSASVSSCKNGFSVTLGLRKYEVLGLEKKQRGLKATVRVEKAGRLHVDTVDFYSSRQRRQLCQDLCSAFEELPETIEGDIAKLLRECEKPPRHQDARGAAENKEEEKTLTAQEIKEATAFGKSANLAERILADYEKCGLIGEESNKLLCYLAMTSRKMPEPLSVLILSSSGAGKTALQDAALGFCPPEDLVKLTSLSAKALFYKERTSLKHKILAIEEGAGAEDASYAIRNLISSDGLTSEVAMRDPQTGKLTTMSNTVDGPTAVFVTTTDPDVDAETKSRFLVTGIDESREQTRKILQFQRERHSLRGLQDNSGKEDTLRVHRNFQRLLKPLAVVNPFIDQLAFEDDRLQSRRLQPQYLGIINAVAFLRQFRKEIKTHAASVSVPAGTSPRLKKNKNVEFIEVEPADIEFANSLAVEVLGRSLDELSIPSRDLLGLLEKMLEGKAEALRRADSERLIRSSDITFTRREIREFTGWRRTRVQIHLKELIEMEYVILESGRVNSLQTYKLLYESQGKDGEKFIPGLKSAADILGFRRVGTA